MSFWVLFQILLDVLAIAGFVVTWYRLNKPMKDDPRFSRSMQILQSKISILEDLSDRTDIQVKQLNALMENKIQEVQKTLQKADVEIQKIESARQKSLEVAKIFQDKIPHQEIIERQNTIKFVKAAVLAHQGKSAEEIQSQIPLSMGEIDFIIKVNRDQLQFAMDELPDWIKDELKETSSISLSGETAIQAGSTMELNKKSNLIENVLIRTESDFNPHNNSNINPNINSNNFPKKESPFKMEDTYFIDKEDRQLSEMGNKIRSAFSEPSNSPQIKKVVFPVIDSRP